jgi:quinol-cytochrome oxidoreductase complex cytochrome b subunit
VSVENFFFFKEFRTALTHAICRPGTIILFFFPYARQNKKYKIPAFETLLTVNFVFSCCLLFFFLTTFKTFSCFAFQNVGKGPTTISLSPLFVPCLVGSVPDWFVRSFMEQLHTQPHILSISFFLRR